MRKKLSLTLFLYYGKNSEILQLHSNFNVVQSEISHNPCNYCFGTFLRVPLCL